MPEENDHFKYKPQAYIIYPSCLYISGSFLMLLFSISMATSTVVHQYKHASIRPDHRIPTPLENSDHLPISITPVLSRTLRRIVEKDFF